MTDYRPSSHDLCPCKVSTVQVTEHAPNRLTLDVKFGAVAEEVLDGLFIVAVVGCTG